MKKNHGMLKEMTEEKKTRENEKPRVFLKKRALGGKEKKEQNIFRIAGNPFLSH